MRRIAVLLVFLVSWESPAHGGLLQMMKLNRAIISGDHEKLQKLLDEGADPDWMLSSGAPPLFLAIEKWSPEAARILIEAGADVDIEDSTGRTALQIAITLGNREITHLLVENGADVNREFDDGWTALLLATRSNQVEMVATLLEAGANPMARTRSGETALSLARSEKVRQLLKDLTGTDPVHPTLPERHGSEVVSSSLRDGSGIEIRHTEQGLVLIATDPKPNEQCLAAKRLRRKFWSENQIRALPKSAELIGNPFQFEGASVAVTGVFQTMETRSLAWFSSDRGFFLVDKIPSGTFKQAGQHAYLAGIVKGKMAPPSSDLRMSVLEFRDVILCRTPSCDDVLAVCPGETIDTDFRALLSD